jgi:hypothetical protein
MRLLCVKQDSYYAFTGAPLIPALIVGNEYNAFDTIDIAGKGRYYKLKECDHRDWFHNSLFATLPDATAEDMQEEETATMYEPVNC